MADVCPVCRGTGWKIKDREGLEFVERCRCELPKKRHNLCEQARIPKRYAHCTLANFRLDLLPDESRQKAKQTVAYFVQAYPAVEAGLFLMGPSGTGKTHLAVAALNELMQEKGVACLFYDFRDLLKTLQNSYSKDTDVSELEVLQPVLKVEVLLLDELGASKMSSWVQDTLAYILNHRYNEKLITLITSNWMDADYYRSQPQKQKKLPEETLEDRIGERLRSRLYEMCQTVQIQMACSDYRHYLHAKNKSDVSQLLKHRSPAS